jgi:tetratricopeptide (TPR) repeat protein
MSHENQSLPQPFDEEISPAEQTELYVAEGDRCGQDGDFTGALRQYKKAAQLIPSPRSLSRLAEGYAANDQPYKAIEYYQRALQATEKDTETEDLSDAHIGLGDLCCSFALSATAIRSYERAVRSRPQNPYYRWKLAVALAAVGLYEKSAQQLQVVLEIAPDDAFYHFQMADLYLLMDQHEDAVREFKATVALAPRDEYYCLRLGAALLQLNRCREALQYFERAASFDPGNASYRVLYHYAQVRNGDEPEISLEVVTLNLGAYDEDFVRRLRRLSKPAFV